MVGNILRLMLGRGLSIIRWNNFPRVVDIKHMDNVGFSLHVALFLVYHEEKSRCPSDIPLYEGELSGSDKKIDRLYIMKQIIFSSLSDIILSDINSGTKGYIQKSDGAIFEKLYTKAFDYIYSFEGGNLLKEDMRQTLADTSHPLEDKIIFAAKKYAGYTEAMTNARVFSEMYEVPIGEIESQLQSASKNLSSLRFLLEDSDAQKYLSHVQRLSFAMRWNQYQRIIPISVMSHKVIVAYLAYIIGTHGNTGGKTSDITEMMMRAIYHDVPEVITGDIITPTKKAVPGFVELLEKVETDMLDDYLFSYISPEYKNYIQSYMLEPFEGELGKKVKYADNLSALFEAKLEVIHGNKNFIEVTKTMMKHNSQIQNEAVEYILKDMTLYFEEIKEDILR